MRTIELACVCLCVCQFIKTVNLGGRYQTAGGRMIAVGEVLVNNGAQ